MLEDLALQYVDLSDSTFKAFNIGILLLGGVAGAITNKSRLELARAPYLVYLALILLFVTATQFVWLGAFAAMAGGYLWGIATVSIISFAVAGVFLGRIAIARSRSAFGHAGMAILAFIPLLNLVLLFKSPMKEVSVDRVPTSPLFTGGLGVLSGLAIVIAGTGLHAFLEFKVEQAAEHAVSNPDLIAMGMEFVLRSEGLEETLRFIATDTQTPVMIDAQTVLSQIKAEGTQLYRYYVADAPMWIMSDDFRARITGIICSYKAFRLLLDAGATFHEIYSRPDGATIGSVVLTSSNCS